MSYRPSLFPLLLLALTITACVPVSNKSARTYQDAYRTQTDATAEERAEDRLVIYEASLELEAREPDTVLNRIVESVKTRGGFFLVRTNDRVAVRVPADQLTAFLDNVATYGKEKSRNVRGQDVTDDYYDQRIRLENAERSRQRYLELLKQAETVEEAVLIEKELGRLTEEIERFKGRLAQLDEQLAYSFVTVYVRPPVKYGPLGYVGYGLWKAVQWIF